MDPADKPIINGGPGRKRKAVRVLSVLLGLILAAALALVLLLPRLIHLEGVKSRISAALSEKTGGPVHIEQAGLSFTPRFSIELSGVRAELPGKMELKAESIAVHPSPVRLLFGEVEISSVKIRSPEISLRIDRLTAPPDGTDIDTRVARLLSAIRTKAPGLELSLRDGVLNLAADGKPTLSVHGVEMDLDLGRSSAKVSAGGGAAFMKRMNVDIDVKADDSAVSSAGFELKAEEVDIGRLREAILPLAGENPVVKAIASYLGEGHIPALSISSEASSIGRLAGLDHLRIKGDLQKGRVFIPVIPLEIRDVTGTCSVEKGILETGDASGIVEGAEAEKVRLQVGLQGGGGPLRLEAEVRSTIGQAAAITARLLKKPPAFIVDLGGVAGTLEGHLTLDGKLSSFKAGSDFGNVGLGFAAKMQTGFAQGITLDLRQRPGGGADSVAIDIEVRDADIRRTAAGLGKVPDDIPVLRKIFTLVPSGRVPQAAVSLRGSSFASLGSLERAAVSGRLEQGSVVLPENGLVLSRVSGAYSLQKGMLEVSGIRASLDGGMGEAADREGTKESMEFEKAGLRLDLLHDEGPLRFETDVRSTIRQAAGVAARLLRNPPSYLVHLGEVRGTFEGRLVLDGYRAMFKPGADRRNLGLSLHVDMKTAFAQSISVNVQLRPGGGAEAVTFDAEVRGADIQSTRSGLGALPEDIPVLRRVFSLVPSGRVPEISVSSRGETFRALSETDHLSVSGKLDEGTVMVPEIEMVLNRVSGAYQIQKGLLKASDVSAEFDEGAGQVAHGALSLPLVKENAPFHLDGETALAAETALKYLRRFLKDRESEIALLQEFRGRISGKVSYDREGGEAGPAKRAFGFDGRVDLDGGPTVDMAMRVVPGELEVSRLRLKDDQSDATIHFTYRNKQLDGQFDGILSVGTLGRVIKMPEGQPGGLVRGRMSADVDFRAPESARLEGSLSVSGLSFPVKARNGEDLSLLVKSMDVRAAPGAFFIDQASLSIAGTDFSLRGTFRPGTDGFILDTDLSTGEIDSARIQELMTPKKNDEQKSIQTEPVQTEQVVEEARPRSITGTVRFSAANMVWKGFAISPYKATIELEPKRIQVVVHEQEVCGISMPGRASLFDDEIDYAFSFSARDRELKPTAACLGGKGNHITGTFSMEGKLNGRGPMREFARTINGDVNFSARNGGVNQAPYLARVLAFIDLSDIFAGSAPDVGKEELPYRSIDAKGDIRDGKLLVRHAVMDSPAFGMTAEGEIDYVTETVYLNLLAAPLKTIDAVVKRLPIIGEIMGGSLIAVPVRVTGTFNNIQINYVPLSSIGTGVLGMMERTVKLPVKIFEPFMSGEKK